MAAAEEWLGAATVARAARADGIGAADLDAARESGLLRFEGEGVTVRNRLVRSSLWADASREERQGAHALLAAALVREWQRPRRLWHRAAVSGEPDDGLAAELADAAAAARTAGRYADSWRSWQRAAALTVDHATRTDRYLAAADDAWASGRSRRARAMLRQARPDGRDGTHAARAAGLRGRIEAAAGSPAAALPMLRDAAEGLAGRDPEAALDALMWAAEAADASGDHRAYLEVAGRGASLDLARSGPRTRLMLDHLAGVAAAIRGRYREAADRLGRAAGPARPSPTPWRARGRRSRRSRSATAPPPAPWRPGRWRPPAGPATRPPSRSRSWSPGAARRCSATRRRPSPRATTGCASRGRPACTGTPPSTTPRSRSPQRSTATRTPPAATWNGWPGPPTSTASPAPPRSARGRPPAWTSPRTGPPTPPPASPCPAAPGSPTRRRGCSPSRTWSRRWCAPASTTGPRGRSSTSAAGPTPPAPAPGRGRSPGAAGRCSPAATARPRSTSPRRCACTRPPAPCSSSPAPSCSSGTGCGAGGGPAPPASTCAPRCGSSNATAPSRGPRGPAPSCAPPGRATTRPARRPGVAKLTAQQAHIARLAAEGATNREIAARLLLSPRTIDHHLRNVFTRLGIRSRVELARLIR
ncbi:helix-turn-helix domain-containing protein [Actinomadura madurae]|uniref:helix-turn-helix domain-containing protein n=1 Tax=Actinomadura madurae TaxID=1993 RepID=UPI0020D22318|nr:LuxR C-terminal-related transcriptional regulator [Actinomadura madurae]MCQ0018959.1 LuxR C-terminal-related transcriptional regulator [Actinomadura madurae]